MKNVSHGQQVFSCPYCHASLTPGALSCRFCGRDLTPVLPLLNRLSELESRLAGIEERLSSANPNQQLLPAPAHLAAEEMTLRIPNLGQRRFLPLLVGFLALLLAYASVVFWLDLPLWILRFSSIAIPLATGFAYLGVRHKLTGADALVAVLFAALSVLAMNATLGFVDSMPILPQNTAAWRETMYYTFSIAASMLSGMLLRVFIVALGMRGLTSLPRLRQCLLSVNKTMPLDTLKAIELTILLLSTITSAIAGLFAGIMGISG